MSADVHPSFLFLPPSPVIRLEEGGRRERQNKLGLLFMPETASTAGKGVDSKNGEKIKITGEGGAFALMSHVYNYLKFARRTFVW